MWGVDVRDLTSEYFLLSDGQSLRAFHVLAGWSEEVAEEPDDSRYLYAMWLEWGEGQTEYLGTAEWSPALAVQGVAYILQPSNEHLEPHAIRSYSTYSTGLSEAKLALLLFFLNETWPELGELVGK